MICVEKQTEKEYLRSLPDAKLAMALRIASEVLRTHDYPFNGRAVKEAARRLGSKK